MLPSGPRRIHRDQNRVWILDLDDPTQRRSKSLKIWRHNFSCFQNKSTCWSVSGLLLMCFESPTLHVETVTSHNERREKQSGSWEFIPLSVKCPVNENTLLRVLPAFLYPLNKETLHLLHTTVWLHSAVTLLSDRRHRVFGSNSSLKIRRVRSISCCCYFDVSDTDLINIKVKVIIHLSWTADIQ